MLVHRTPQIRTLTDRPRCGCIQAPDEDPVLNAAVSAATSVKDLKGKVKEIDTELDRITFQDKASLAKVRVLPETCSDTWLTFVSLAQAKKEIQTNAKLAANKVAIDKQIK